MKAVIMKMIYGIVFMALMVVGCGSNDAPPAQDVAGIVDHAEKAQEKGEVISNYMMQYMYPETYRAGIPAYLERDFEAGADFICDQIQLEYGEDLCASDAIHWR